MLDGNVRVLLCIMWHVSSHIRDQYVFFQITLIKSLELCQVLVSHFVTLTEDCAAPDRVPEL